jgi:hypothetical protein
MVTYALPVVMLTALPMVAREAMARYSERDAALLGAVLVVTFELVLYGAGLPIAWGLHDYRTRDTPTIRFVASLPKDATVAAGIDESSYVQVFAHRKALFSAITNVPHFDRYGAEIERRISAYYEAYYAGDLAPLRRLRHQEHVDYLIADSRDFGPEASQRAKYIDPWTGFAGALLRRTPTPRMVLAHPPPGAVAFRHRTTFVVDLHRL